MTTPKLSIVTGTRNRPESYRRFLDSVFHAASIDYEVIVVDASDGDEPYTENFDHYPDTGEVRVVIEHPRLGPMRGYNLGFREARGEYVVWFNDDCELIPGWDKIAIDFLEANPEVGMGCVYFKDHLGGGDTGNGDFDGADPTRFGPRYNTQALFGIVYANFGIMKRELGNEIGWFDETLGYMYGCDTDLSFEAIWRGWQVVGIPECRVLHWRQRDKEREDTRPLCRQDRAKFDAKWVPRLDQLRNLRDGWAGKVSWADKVGPRSIGDPK